MLELNKTKGLKNMKLQEKDGYQAVSKSFYRKTRSVTADTERVIAVSKIKVPRFLAG